jgi:FtsH-binding integral membrane protein
MKSSRETKKNLASLLLSLVGGLMITFSGFSQGFYAQRYAIGMFIMFFGIVPGLLLGITILLCTLARKRITVVILSLISLLYLSWIYGSLLYGDGNFLPLLLVATGGISGTLGGIMTEKRTKQTHVNHV